MKLIISYTVGDHCSQNWRWSSDIIEPALYSSVEALYCDLIDTCEKAFSEKKQEFTVGGIEFLVDYFIFRNHRITNVRGKISYCRIWPKIMTIDEWFDESEKNKELIIEEVK